MKLLGILVFGKLRYLLEEWAARKWGLGADRHEKDPQAVFLDLPQASVPRQRQRQPTEQKTYPPLKAV